MKVANKYKKLRDNWYSWTVSIEGSPKELKDIKYVTYLLHETFPKPRIVSTNAANKFARTIQGWGEFLLRAEVTMKTGEVKHAELWLNLGFTDKGDQKIKYAGDLK